MTLPKLFIGAAGVAAGAAVICNLAPWLVAKPELATLDYLAAAKLQTLDGQKRNFSEAQGLSSLVPEMDARGVRLHAVVHEVLGAEDFKPFIKGSVYLDPERHFYGPKERWMSYVGFLNFGSIKYAIEVLTKRVPGKVEGEGRLLGALFVVGPGDQGIVFQHHEKLIGDHASLDDVRAALQKVNLPRT